VSQTPHCGEQSNPVWDGLFRVTVSAAVTPFDHVLAGMIEAGLGITALCLYLECARIGLFERVTRLGLQTPSDRPLRRGGGRNPWATEDVQRFIRWWMAGVQVRSIAEGLGRSPGAIYGKRRRLGLPQRDRRQLTYRSVEELLRGLASETVASPEELPGEGGGEHSVNWDAAAATQTASEVINTVGAARAAEPPFSFEAEAASSPLASGAAVLAGTADHSERRGIAALPASVPDELSVDEADLIVDFSRAKGNWRIPELKPTPQIAKKVVAVEDPSAPGRKSQPHVGPSIKWTAARDENLTARAFAMQSVAGIARDLDLRPGQISCRMRTLGLGEARRFLRRSVGLRYLAVYDPKAPTANISLSRYYLRECCVTRTMFWAQRGSGQTMRPDVRNSKRYAKARQARNVAAAIAA